jgi:hypothetical protein
MRIQHCKQPRGLLRRTALPNLADRNHPCQQSDDAVDVGQRKKFVEPVVVNEPAFMQRGILRRTASNRPTGELLPRAVLDAA